MQSKRQAAALAQQIKAGETMNGLVALTNASAELVRPNLVVG